MLYRLFSPCSCFNDLLTIQQDRDSRRMDSTTATTAAATPGSKTNSATATTTNNNSSGSSSNDDFGPSIEPCYNLGSFADDSPQRGHRSSPLHPGYRHSPPSNYNTYLSYPYNQSHSYSEPWNSPSPPKKARRWSPDKRESPFRSPMVTDAHKVRTVRCPQE